MWVHLPQPWPYVFRKLRLFAQQDLPTLIEKEGVQPAAADSVFSLEVFDNTDYETRLPEDWVPRGAGVKKCGGPGGCLPWGLPQGTGISEKQLGGD